MTDVIGGLIAVLVASIGLGGVWLFLGRDKGSHAGGERVVYRDRIISVPEVHHDEFLAAPLAIPIGHIDSPAGPAGVPGEGSASAAEAPEEAPGAGAPEGDAASHPPRPVKGAGPGDLHAAVKAFQHMPLDDYLAQLPDWEHSTGWFQAIGDYDCPDPGGPDLPFSAPLEWHQEMAAS